MATINEGQYCHVDTSGVDFVDEGPTILPQNWKSSDDVWYYNLNNSDIWTDPDLKTIDWLPYVEIDDGEPQDGKSYNRELSDFVITDTQVSRTAIYTEWTQAEYDLNADTTITDSQRIAQDLALQTEAILLQNTNRNNTGVAPIIPPDDLADVNTYLGELYQSMDDPDIPPKEPPGATRQATVVVGERVDRATVRRTIVDWAGQDYTKLGYTLYTGVDATGMSFKVHLIDGTYLSTYNLTEQSPGIWYAETNIIGALQGTTVDLSYVLFKGVDISQMRDFLHTDADQIFDVRWLTNGASGLALGERGRSGSAPGRNR